MLCFMQGFDVPNIPTNVIKTSKDKKFQSVKSKLLKRSRSSSNVISGASSRSAPSTPQTGPGARSQPNSPIPKSPSHGFQHDKTSGSSSGSGFTMDNTVKHLSTSALTTTMTTTTTQIGNDDKMPAGSSKARQKKFHRHFAQVDENERVLNYYSCALVGDILLQGHLYVTKNYFGFYSNVFGYVTKLLIPIASVVKISKERTARIIPNAVAVITNEEKHVFSSLLSRDSTYKLMAMVIRAANAIEPAEAELPPPKDLRPGELETLELSGDDEDTSSQSGNELELKMKVNNKSEIKEQQIEQQTLIEQTKIQHSPGVNITKNNNNQYNLFLLASVLLLLLLFLSAGVLLYRINNLQTRTIGSSAAGGFHTTNDVYNEILHWQHQLHSKSAGAVHNFLDTNLEQIAVVRKSLEALSTLLMPQESKRDNGNS